MELILEFIKNHYIIFCIISGVLILALVGYLVEWKLGQDFKVKKGKNKETEAVDMNIDTI